MLFPSPLFLLLLGAVLALRPWLPPRPGQLLLLAASYTFYGAAHPWYVLLLLGSTLVDHLVALRLAATTHVPTRRGLLGLSLAANLGLLGLFKYGDFVLTSLAAWVPGLAPEPLPSLGWVLPVGISFYTFQTLSYVIDVYRRELEPTRDLLAFALYVAFFPQLVAGPIERAAHLLPQLQRKGQPSRDDLVLGFQRMLWGLVKKVVVADRLAILVDDALASTADASGLALAVTLVAATFSVYLDFSAYSDMAIGMARMLGVDLVENFRWPFLSRSPGEFWSRWHMTLTAWFRDYVARPLGRERRTGPGSTLLRTTFVMTLVGLWHGAAWTFVTFGLVAGLVMGLCTVVRALCRRRGRERVLGDRVWSAPLAVAGTFLYVNLCMAFFIAPDLDTAWTLLAGCVTRPWTWSAELTLPVVLLTGLWLLHLVRALRPEPRRELALPAPLRGAAWALLVVLLLYGAPAATRPFVYFQF